MGNFAWSRPTRRLLAGGGIAVALTFAYAPMSFAQTPDGAALYRRHCRACHGAEGVPAQGMAKAFPGLKSLADTTFMGGVSEDSVVHVLQHGAGAMKSFHEKLSDDEMRAIAQFVKTLGHPTQGS